MNARQRRKVLKKRAADPDILIRLDAKTDLILERFDQADRRSALLGAVSGGIAGGVVACVVLYARSVLFGVR